MDSQRRIAPYRIISDAEGRGCRFFCELSGIAVCTAVSPDIDGGDEERALFLWETQARSRFNRCRKCGRWVSDIVFNVVSSECVECSPWYEQPNFCPRCGTRIHGGDSFCRKCGESLFPEGGAAYV